MPWGLEDKNSVLHQAVMCKEVINYLRLEPEKLILDCTVGCGGHAKEILKAIEPGGKLIGIDRDEETLRIARDRLKAFEGSYILVHDNFENIDKILTELKIEKIDGVIFDLGLSSFQLEVADRGFSIRLDGQLDMRMDRSRGISVQELVNQFPQEKIADILRRFGQERWAKRIARAIVNRRKTAPIVTTGQLADIVTRTIPRRSRYQRIHPATRTFQALRIAVNRELEALENGLNSIIIWLNPRARVCVISFHSLEDRIVKNRFREFSREDILKIITPKPLTPTSEEIKSNPRCRSAKFRVAEKI